MSDIGNETVLFGELAKVPNDRVRNFRNDMYLVSEALRLMQKTHQPEIAASDWLVLSNYKKHIDNATKFIPLWVKVAVAIALEPLAPSAPVSSLLCEEHALSATNNKAHGFETNARQPLIFLVMLTPS